MGVARTAAWCMLTCAVPFSEAHGPCGEYGCDLTCNHGGCQEVARVCPVGFSMTETAVGIRCTGERPGSSGGGVGRNYVHSLSCQDGLQRDARAGLGQDELCRLRVGRESCKPKEYVGTSMGQQRSWGWGQ